MAVGVTKNRDARSASQVSVQPSAIHGLGLTLPKPNIPTGGRLRFFSKAWEEITSDPWTQSVIRSGYRIPFRVRPFLQRLPPRCVQTIPSDQEKLCVLRDEVEAMLQKQAIERVTSQHRSTGFFSRLFLVRKKTGGWRPIIDLSQLNKSIVSTNFNDGDVRQSPSVSECGGLGHVFRPDGCLFPYLNTSSVQALPSVCISRGGVPVPSTSVRPMHGSICLLQGSEGYAPLYTSAGYSSSRLSGRLASTSQFQGDGRETHTSSPIRDSTYGVCSQLGQIGADTYTGVCIPGRQVQPVTGVNRAVFGPCFADSRTDHVPAASTCCFSEDVTCPARPDGIDGTALASGPYSQAFATVGNQVPLVAGDTLLGQNHRPRHVVSGGGFTVVGSGVHVLHGSYPPASAGHSPLHGCQSYWLGSSPARPGGFREVVNVLAPLSYQHSRTSSSLSGSETVRQCDRVSLCASGNRQHNGGGLCEQGGGLSFREALPSVDEDLDLVCKALCHAESSLPPRETEHFSRQSVSQRHDSAHGMDNACRGPQTGVLLVGDAACGSVCHQVEQPASDIRLPSSRPQCTGGRRIEHFLGGDARIRVSPVPIAISGNSQDQQRIESGLTDCPTLARPTVVQSPVVSSGGSTHLSSIEERHSVPTSVSAVPRQPRDAPTARILTMQRCMQEKGFSEPVAQRVCSSKRPSTNSVYGYRWKVWVDWCVGRQVDSFSPSVNSVAEFLIFLFEVKKLSPVAVKGYRSAIATTLKNFSDIDYSNQSVLSNVLRSMELERPKTLFTMESSIGFRRFV